MHRHAEPSTTIGDRGPRSSQHSVRRVTITPPDTIRTLPFGTGLIMLRATPPIIARLQMWTERPDGKTQRADRAKIEASMRAPAHHEPEEPPNTEAE
ncbi:hypothetical protein GCM10027057_05380 [Marisediminicola antarctica]